MNNLEQENAELKKTIEGLNKQIVYLMDQLSKYQKQDKKRWLDEQDHLSYEESYDRS
jgi:uncharacterized coiled-coil protein SlyX